MSQSKSFTVHQHHTNNSNSSRGAQLMPTLQSFQEKRNNLDHDRFSISLGKLKHYQSLAHHHYKAAQPCTATTIFVLYDNHATDIISQFKNTTAAADSKPIGVLVRSYVQLNNQLRDLATAGRYTRLAPRARAKMLNHEIRIISRVIIDPRYRGLGLAVKLVKHALQNPETTYTEALAAMGRVNPFFEKAGMTCYHAPPRPEHARFQIVIQELNLQPHLLASTKTLTNQLNKKTPTQRTWFEAELRRWTALAFRLPKKIQNTITYQECLALARDHLLTRPLYYLHQKKCQTPFR